MVDEEKEEDDIKAFQREIEEKGQKGGRETFGIALTDEVVILSITIGEEKDLAITLPPPIAFELGQALVNSALIVGMGGDKVDLGEISDGIPPPLKKEELN